MAKSFCGVGDDGNVTNCALIIALDWKIGLIFNGDSSGASKQSRVDLVHSDLWAEQVGPTIM